jgi:hypothetical protein
LTEETNSEGWIAGGKSSERSDCPHSRNAKFNILVLGRNMTTANTRRIVDSFLRSSNAEHFEHFVWK